MTIPQIKKDAYALLKGITTASVFLGEPIKAETRLTAINLIFQIPDNWIAELEADAVEVDECAPSIEEHLEAQDAWAAVETNERKEELQRQLELIQVELESM